MPGANGKGRRGISGSGGFKHLGDQTDGEDKQAGVASAERWLARNWERLGLGECRMGDGE